MRIVPSYHESAGLQWMVDWRVEGVHEGGCAQRVGVACVQENTSLCCLTAMSSQEVVIEKVLEDGECSSYRYENAGLLSIAFTSESCTSRYDEVCDPDSTQLSCLQTTVIHCVTHPCVILTN